MKNYFLYRLIFVFLVATLIGIVMITPAMSSTQELLPKEKNWEFNLAPLYLWAMSMDGELTARGRTRTLDADFGQITDSLEGVLTLHFEGMYKNGWGFLTDISYLNLGGQQNTPGPAPLTIDVDFTQVMVELAGVYRSLLGKNAMDVFGGIRYYGLDTKIDIVGAPNPREVDEGKEWVDAMLGARYIWNISNKWNFNARGDIGLSGNGFNYNLAGLFNFQPWKHASFLFGYRYMDINYKDGSGADLFRYYITLDGPIVALNFVW